LPEILNLLMVRIMPERYTGTGLQHNEDVRNPVLFQAKDTGAPHPAALPGGRAGHVRSEAVSGFL